MNTVDKDKIRGLVDNVCSLSLEMVQEFINQLSTRLNIDLTTLRSSGSNVESAAPTQVEEKKSIYIIGIKDGKRSSVVKQVNITLGLNSLIAANDKLKIVESTPLLVKADITVADAQELIKTLEEAGAVIELR